jgi:hypothetical protein
MARCDVDSRPALPRAAPRITPRAGDCNSETSPAMNAVCGVSALPARGRPRCFRSRSPERTEVGSDRHLERLAAFAMNSGHSSHCATGPCNTWDFN